MYFASRVFNVARNRATEDYVSLRLFMHVPHNKDFRISTQRLLVLTAILQTGAGRNERGN